MAQFNLTTPGVLRQITGIGIGPVNFAGDNLVYVTIRGQTADGASLAEWIVPIRNAAAGAGKSGMLVRCPDPITPGGVFQIVDGPAIPLGHFRILTGAGIAAATAAQAGKTPSEILFATHNAVIQLGLADGWIHPGVFSGEVYALPPIEETPPPPEEPAE